MSNERLRKLKGGEDLLGFEYELLHYCPALPGVHRYMLKVGLPQLLIIIPYCLHSMSLGVFIFFMWYNPAFPPEMDKKYP